MEYHKWSLREGKNDNDKPIRFISNGNVLSGSLEIADGFNDFFFVNVGPYLASEIPKSKKWFTEYMNEPCSENFVFANISHEIILNALEKLKSKNSCGPDKISTRLVKRIAPSILDPLSHLFNPSCRTGFIPTCLKTAANIQERWFWWFHIL